MRKAKKRKGIKAQRVKPSTKVWVTDALRGEKEQNGKQKENKRKETGSGSPSWLPPDHLVASYDPHGSYIGPILTAPPWL